MSKKITNPVDDLIGVIASAVEQWKADNTPEVMQRKTVELLNANSEEIVLKLLGFNKDTWRGKWELDHCNGRNGNSTAGDYLRAQQTQIIKDWLDKVPLPVLTKEAKASFIYEAKVIYHRAVHEAIRHKVTSKAQADVDELFKQITDKTNQTNYFKLLEIVNPIKEYK